MVPYFLDYKSPEEYSHALRLASECFRLQTGDVWRLNWDSLLLCADELRCGEVKKKNESERSVLVNFTDQSCGVQNFSRLTPYLRVVPVQDLSMEGKCITPSLIFPYSIMSLHTDGKAYDLLQDCMVVSQMTHYVHSLPCTLPSRVWISGGSDRLRRIVDGSFVFLLTGRVSRFPDDGEWHRMLVIRSWRFILLNFMPSMTSATDRSRSVFFSSSVHTAVVCLP